MDPAEPRNIWLSLSAHLRGDFDGGDVGLRINILHSSAVRVSVGELHTDASLVGHNVSVGDDEAIAADDKTRPIRHGNFSSWERISVKEQKQLSDFVILSHFILYVCRSGKGEKSIHLSRVIEMQIILKYLPLEFISGL